MLNESQIPVQRSCQAFTNSVEGNESMLEYFRRRFLVFLRSVMRKSRRAAKSGTSAPILPAWAQTSMDLQAGNRVRVRTHSEIAADPGRTRILQRMQIYGTNGPILRT